MPEPTKEHQWLSQLAGEWVSECEALVPGQESIKAKATENARIIGGFWLVGESDGEMMGTPVKTILTLGYDPRRGKFVGSWIGSCTTRTTPTRARSTKRAKHSRSKLAADPMNPAEIANFREVLEVQDPTHKIFTSYIEVDGKWQKIVTVTSTRRK